MRLIRLFAMTIVLATGLIGCGSSSAESGDESSGLLDFMKTGPKITLDAGTTLRVALIDAVSTTKSSPGDEFTATLIEPIVVGEKTVVEKGAKVRGRVTDVRESGRVEGRASIRLILTEIVHEGDTIAIETKPFVAVAESTTKRDAGIIAGGAGVGAAIGAIAGGKKGAGIGAAIGGGTGTGAVLATKGDDLHYGPETRLTFTLASSLQI